MMQLYPLLGPGTLILLEDAILYCLTSHACCVAVCVCVCDMQCVCMQCVRELHVCVPAWYTSVMYMSRLHMSNLGFFYFQFILSHVI